MTHFSPAEVVDAAEGTLAPPRAVHIEACGRCRAEVETLSAAIRETAAIDAPEPSPLFWQHFSARVHEAIAAEPGANTGWDWLRPRRWVHLAVTCTLLVAAFSGIWLAHDARSGMATAVVSDIAAPAVSIVANGDTGRDAAWAILTAAAADMKVDEARAAGLGVSSGTVDNAVQRLTPAERRELGRLLQNELKRSGN